MYGRHPPFHCRTIHGPLQSWCLSSPYIFLFWECINFWQQIIGQQKNPTWNKRQAVNAWNVPCAFSVRLGLESSLCAAVRAETFQGYKSLPSKSFRKIRSWFEQNTTSAPRIRWNPVNNISYKSIDYDGVNILWMCKSKIGGNLSAWIEAITKTTFHVKNGFCGHSPPGNVVYFDLS